MSTLDYVRANPKASWDDWIADIARAATNNDLTFFAAYRNLPRGIGTTWKQVKAAPDGAIYLVASSGTRHEIERMLGRQGRDHRALDIHLVDLHGPSDRLQGGSTYTTVDHSVWSLMTEPGVESLLHAAQYSNARYNEKQQVAAA